MTNGPARVHYRRLEPDDEVDRQRRAARCAQTAMNTMVAAGVPLTPENFAIFYAHAENRLPELTVFLDRLLAEKRSLSPELCSTLHRKFLGPATELETVRAASECLLRTLDATRRDIGQARQITEDFGTVLKGQRSGDGRGPGSRSAKVEDELAELLQHMSDVQDRLRRSEEEVAELKDRLAAVERAAKTDSLTGLANRRYFEDHLDETVRRCRATSQGVSVLMADIDYFKAFNDRHGHAIGDQVLRLVARVILDNVRPGDVAARYGGEEFVILLPHASPAEALEVAERINTGLRSREFMERHSGRRLGNVTMSIGIATLRPGEPIDGTLRRADLALYRAKADGRNRVCSDEAETVQAPG